MKVACFIPIKENFEKVVGKDLRVVNGKKLYEYICVFHVLKDNSRTHDNLLMQPAYP
jgi:CMP-N-acetylneuraminic acid synthetase